MAGQGGHRVQTGLGGPSGRVPSDEVPPALRAGLRRWFAPRRRAYPWRGTGDVWKALVAEVMLHQTQESRATPAWSRFVRDFPSPARYAAADDDAVTRAWAGLGYYRRAFLLRDAATALAVAPSPPHDAAGLGALPGVGPYTAAILASTVFGEPVAAIDGNVTRVVARLRGLEGDPSSRAFRAGVQAAATALLDPSDPGGWNEAVMDLGREICTPRAPQCPRCPVAAWCAARQSGRQDRIPRPRRASRRRVHVAVGVVDGPDGVLVVRRPGRGLLARQRALPTAEGADPAQAVERLEAVVAGILGKKTPAQPIGTERHVFTHREWDVRVYRLALPASAPLCEDQGRWVPRGRLAAVPFPSLYARIAGAFAGPQRRLS